MFVLSHVDADDFLHITTVLEERISGTWYEQSLNLGEFDTVKSILESGRGKVVYPPYL